MYLLFKCTDCEGTDEFLFDNAILKCACGQPVELPEGLSFEILEEKPKVGEVE